MMIAALTRGIIVLMAFGWLAESLAATNNDVDASVAAYETQSWEEALQHLDSATETLGERPELMYNRGLVLLATGDKEGARSALERGTESEHLQVRGSSHYELGNLDFDQGEAWEAAIEHYIECLKVMPNHDKAKWNLELARQKLKEAEEQKKKEEEEKKQEQEEQEKNEGQDGEKGEDGEPSEDQQEPPSETDSEESSESDSGGEDETTGSEDGGETGEPPETPEQEPKQEPKKEPEQEEPSPPPQKPESESSDAESNAAPPQAVERVDIGKSLEQLDEQDNFMLGIPSGSKVPVEKDW